MNLARTWGLYSFLCLAFLIFSSTAFADGQTHVDLSGVYLGESESDEPGKNTKIQRNIAGASIMRIQEIGPKRNLILGIDYTGQFVDYSNFSGFSLPSGNPVTTSDLPEELHALNFTLGYQTMISGFKTTFTFNPGIHGDFHDIDGDHIVYQGSVLAEKKFGQKNVWGLGAYFSDNLGDEQVLPLARLFWYPSKNWFLETTLPKDFKAGYQLSSSTRLGIGANLYGYQYRLTKGPFNGEVLNYREIQLGPYYEYKFSQGRGFFRLMGGISTGQNFEFNDKDNDNKIAEGDFENSGFVSVSMRYAF